MRRRPHPLLALSLALGTSAAVGRRPEAALREQDVSTGTPGHAVNIDVDLKGAKELWLVVTDAGDGFGCDWADWAEPRLVGPSGETKLTALKWKEAASGFGEVRVDANAGRRPAEDRRQGRRRRHRHARAVGHRLRPARRA